jgi:cadmium resistance transport/sequestration family protein
LNVTFTSLIVFQSFLDVFGSDLWHFCDATTAFTKNRSSNATKSGRNSLQIQRQRKALNQSIVNSQQLFDMSGLVTAMSTGVAAFGATNVDDIVILTLFFSQVNATFRRWHIVVGQYLGFTALVFASLPGFFGGFIVPRPWIGLFGLIPIVIGIKCLVNREEDSSEEMEEQSLQSNHSVVAKFFNLQIYSVAAVTFANGSDNISIYVPLFASSTWEGLLVILGVFFLLVGVLCFVAYQLNNQRAITELLSCHGNNFVPFVLMGLGTLIMVESGLLTLLIPEITSEFLSSL